MKRKILITVCILLVSMLIVPVLIVNLAADAGMALCFIMFFVIDPLVILGLSIMAGTDIPNLWWIPAVSALVFPAFFSVAVQEFVAELYAYAGIYLVIGIVAMLGTHLGMKIANKKKQ